MALPTSGRVVIETTAGDIDIELWAKETPKACRNFLALAMEGYYDGVIFHRIVPGFLIQTGDRTGTGNGGESFFGEQFEDEIHPRLRFAHRGLVALANNGSKNSNDSQFIITLDRADELHGKHTLFGRCVGDTVYNVLKIGEMEIDADGRPIYPPKIKQIRIITNPFNDIIPRITAQEKRAQQLAREQNQREREEATRRKGAKKNVQLLSFGGDEDAEEGATSLKKSIVRPDLLEPEPPAIPQMPLPSKSRLADQNVLKHASNQQTETPPNAKDVDISTIREKHAKEQTAESILRKAEIEKMESDIRKLARRREGEVDEEPISKKRKGASYLEEELSKYTRGRAATRKHSKRKDEGDILSELKSFRAKLKNTSSADLAPTHTESPNIPDPESEGREVDDDTSWQAHMLHFPKDDGMESVRAERDYEVIDPRARKAQAKEEEIERKRARKSYVGDAFRHARGAFIVIEGLDRSGKSTQAALLYEQLVALLGPSLVKLIKFPDRTTPIGKMIDSYLRSKSELDDRAIHLLFSANRWELAKTIESDLGSGITILCDRYAFSGAAFSCAKPLPYDWCLAPDVSLPAPDLVIFLDISPEAAKARGGYGEERYEKEALQRNVRTVFEKLSQEPGPPWTKLDAGRPVETVKAEIWEVVQGLTAGMQMPVEKLWGARLVQQVAKND